MMPIIAIEQLDQGAGVENDLLFHWPKSRR